MFPTLAATIELESEHGNGLCFHRSAALCYDLPLSQVVIGVFQPADCEEALADPNASMVPFYHCWVEYKGCVLAPTLIERMGKLAPMERTSYYKVNGAQNIGRVSRSKLLEIFKRNPELMLQLKFGTMPESHGLLVDKLMRSAKLTYQLNNRSGVLPL